MEQQKAEYAFVIDKAGKPLSPTKANKAWYLVRKGRASLECRYPMVVRLQREIDPDEIDSSEILCGIDDGSAHVGIALVQKGKTKDKAIFKGTIEQRQDVKHLMDRRRAYRRYRRYHKRYRKPIGQVPAGKAG